MPVGEDGESEGREETEEPGKPDEVMSKDSEGMEGEEEGEEELRPLWYKLRGTLGITIISMGVLIFIGSLVGCSWLSWKWKRKTTAPSAQLTVALQRMTPPPSPSIHNDGKALGAANYQPPTHGLSQASSALCPQSVSSPTLEQSQQPSLSPAVKYCQNADNDKSIEGTPSETFTVTFICEQI
ncbi:unnamed protein product [Allacma fusca]|uniref:Uncharacterized protein n=1 Tax=Allacma fusca TaxID=39272 RepID=A0A8J2L427_9HEXA|nr:unnamed protein product [Allacma fusca]